MNSEPLVLLLDRYFTGAAAISVYERWWISQLAVPLIPLLVFFGSLCAPLITAHEVSVHFCADIVSLGVHITPPTHSCEYTPAAGLEHFLIAGWSSYNVCVVI